MYCIKPLKINIKLKLTVCKLSIHQSKTYTLIKMYITFELIQMYNKKIGL
jgi:hypothetical protein